MKKILTIVFVFVLAGIGTYLFITRGAPAPSKSSPAYESSNVTAGSDVYQISIGSEASFSIYESLNGAPKTVVGVTPDVGGEITINEGQMNIGVITVNTRTFRTDSERRDGAISRLILRSDRPENEFIVFTPHKNDGVAVVDGEEVSFRLSGDLSISGVVRTVTFNIEATVDDDMVSGLATTTIRRSDFNLVVPDLSFIADVADEVVLSATVVATRSTK